MKAKDQKREGQRNNADQPAEKRNRAAPDACDPLRIAKRQQFAVQRKPNGRAALRTAAVRGQPAQVISAPPTMDRAIYHKPALLETG